MDEFLKSLGIDVKYEDLNATERATLYSWVDSLQKSELTIEKVKGYITTMRESVEQDLTKTTLDKREDIFLKARLRNYILLEGFLYGPERAKQALKKALEGVKTN